jgi:type I restriction enzyme M protein
MIDIRGNYFYTRTVPCQLWFYDRAKERDARRADHVLMLDARNIFRKVSRSLCDFSPEQQKNIAAIVWLYRGQADRFLRLVESYLAEAVALGQSAKEPLDSFIEKLIGLVDLIEPFATETRNPDPLAESWKELMAAQATVKSDVCQFHTYAQDEAAAWKKSSNGKPRKNNKLQAARKTLQEISAQCRDLTKQVDLAVKLAGRVIDTALKECDAKNSELWGNGEINKARKALETARAEAVEALRLTRYFIRQADWLQERFPEAKLQDVAGLVKLVSRAEIEAHDWSLTPGRYVGVAPEEVDQDFDFEETLRSIHIDLNGLNEEAAQMAVQIAKNFEELGA